MGAGLKRARAAVKETQGVFTLAGVKKRIAGLPAEQAKSVVCALVGHSMIQTHCFGYFNCARCGERVGDSLGSIYPGAEKAVIVGHNCKTCRDNFSALDWRSKFMTPDPFKAEAVE
jgi:hypothetical protein